MGTDRVTPAARFGRGMLILGLLLVAALAALLLFASTLYDRWQAGPRPETIAAASLQSLREQNVLVPFTARFVAVVTSTQTVMGLSAQKTLILPGTVRYELDLGQLAANDLSWDGDTRTLTVTLPPVRIGGPEIDMTDAREYKDGQLLMLLTDTERRLDASNARAARDELIRQARSTVPMRLAQGAALRAIEQNFALPLRAAGVEATVSVRFRGVT
jgi:hypothetical protein